jgi:hypothetical protein
MGRSHDAAIITDPTAPQPAWVSVTSRSSQSWGFFCVLVVVLKLLLLWLDSTPKLFMGDSGSYIWTALTGWIPPDRSYVYGYVVRWLAVWPHSFTPLLVAQALAGAVTAIVFAIICKRFFEMSNTVSYIFAFLCAADPCQLVWERYVMTETFSLLVYILVLYWSLAYIRNRRIWQLAVVQGVSVLLIGFRMSYLPVVQACTILLPVIAFLRCAFPAVHGRSGAISRASVIKTSLVHVAASIAMMFVMHGAYKQMNGWLSDDEPAYLYDSGAHLVAVWAPALQASDATDSRFGDLIANGRQFNIQSLRLRDAQQFGKGFLVDRWSEIEKDQKKRDRVARETAMNALRRRPLQIVGLAVTTYMGFCGIESVQKYARKDLGYGRVSDDQLKMVAEKFGFVTAKQLPKQPLSLLQRYFIAAWPYYFVVIASPLICGFAIFTGRNRAFAVLLIVHVSILLVVITALSPRPCIRYLQPVSVLTLLGIAVCVDCFARTQGGQRRNQLFDSATSKTAFSGSARPEGLEPSTYGLEIRCSIPLSYGRRISTDLYPVFTANKGCVTSLASLLMRS